MEHIKSTRELSKMPFIIGDADFNKKLRMPSKNVEHTQSFLDNGVTDYTLPEYVVPHGYRLVKSLKKDQFRMIADGKEPETVYLVEVFFREDIVVGKTTCTQIKVWRTVSAKHQEVVSGFPKTFFKHLLMNHNIVVTDEQQTGDGKRFWEAIISWALNMKYNVYASDGTQEDRPLIIIKTMDEFYDKWDEFCWGHDPEVHTHRLVVISRTPLV
ncbi:hypothetical protein [Xenorhabdus szentirmaii]|uniref:Phage protein n=1 Tax=Xenorhabdus szentirmaii DSM 16338 TaxID=1427518 RepID=W1IUT7_9GAMM|nr:hypothetical protein [Xenorhabdus szentirmaii]PHM30613.1 phage protein [Xenorhabdus szentirmaii DSM 16338]CDL80950.1 conserved hypothetical protein [Xenorhabdus szentirmaii DSM 16338]